MKDETAVLTSQAGGPNGKASEEGNEEGREAP
jgi:hypothetical protein